MKLRNKSGIILSFSWIIIFLFRGGTTLSDGWFFLLSVDKSFIQNEEIVYSQSQLWKMHNGTLCIFGIIVFLYFLIIHILDGVELKKK
ncbi:MAG: hypothetical protein MK193_05875 [Lentisphaeria bacterium]|nr:hypothetical protein [Lentisphaeria bacterium]